VTHPAFGRRIRALEAWAGAPLIDRDAASLRFTAQGEVVLEAARETVAALAVARRAHGYPPDPREKEIAQAESPAVPIDGGIAARGTPPPGTAGVPPPAEATEPAAPERNPDEAWIETGRCPSCNECQNINDKMFKYNGNKQAYIVDVKLGTYRQMVEAAEACQVSIIHPGKPWNPNEPGLDELITRADAFR